MYNFLPFPLFLAKLTLAFSPPTPQLVEEYGGEKQKKE
jgi:hypothetical protein